MTDQNKRFAELAGIDANLAYTKIHCPNCGYLCTGKSVFCTPPIPVWPDYESDARQVVETVREKGLLMKFIYYLIPAGEYGWDAATTMADLITDKTGRMATLATEWIERGKG